MSRGGVGPWAGLTRHKTVALCLGRVGAPAGPPDPTQNGGFVSREGGGMPPLFPDTKRWFCVSGRGGHAPPPHPTENGGFVTKAWFYVAGQGGGHAPPRLRHKTVVLRRRRGGHAPLLLRQKALVLRCQQCCHPKCRISTPALRQKLSFGITCIV